jgi:hypothetical protein
MASQGLPGPSPRKRGRFERDVEVILDFTRILDLRVIGVCAIDEGDLLGCRPTRRLRRGRVWQGDRATSVRSRGYGRVCSRHDVQTWPLLRNISAIFLEGAVERILRRVMAASHGLYTSFPAFGYESHYIELGTAGTKRTTSEDCLYILPSPVNLELKLVLLTSCGKENRSCGPSR